MTSARRHLVSWTQAGILIAVTPVLVWWLERLIAIPSSGWFKPTTAFALGGDLRTFHSAAQLAVEGGGDVIYNIDAFRAFFADTAGAYGPFVNPPPFLAFVAPIGWLSFEAAWFALAAITVVSLGVGLRLLGVSRLRWGIGATLLFAPVYFAITFGQPSALWLLIFAATYALLRYDRHVWAGVVAGLLVMKPSLAAGLALWWLVDWGRYRRAAIAAVCASVGYLAVSYAVVPDAWPGYLSSFTELLGEPEFPPRQWAQFAPWSSWGLLFPNGGLPALVAGVAAVGLALAALLPALRRATSLEQAFSAAVLLTLLATPYVIAYDWTLLIAPAVLMWRWLDKLQKQLLPSVIVVAISSAWSTWVVIEMLESGESALQIAPLVLLAVVWYNRRLFSSAGSRSAASG